MKARTDMKRMQLGVGAATVLALTLALTGCTTVGTLASDCPGNSMDKYQDVRQQSTLGTVDIESSDLHTACGAFVTLNERGRLRGCIGHVRGDVPLRQTDAEMAVQAALHDPRFPSVTKEEVESLEIEISVLSPLTEVKDVSEIVVGRDGLIIQEGARSGLLLPQVATEYGWDRETFLEHTCRKAGLPEGCWRREGVVILRFSAEVFNEREVLGER